MKQCVLHPEKTCSDCGECDDLCMLDPTKICDNCFRCLESEDRPYAKIPISGVFFEDDYSHGSEKGGLFAPDVDEDYVLDSDDAWKAGFCLHVRTLRSAYASRAKRRHIYR